MTGYEASVALVGNRELLTDPEAGMADACELILDKLPVIDGFKVYRVEAPDWPREGGRCIYPLANLRAQPFEFKVLRKDWVLGLKGTKLVTSGPQFEDFDGKILPTYRDVVWWEPLANFPHGYDLTKLTVVVVTALDKFMEAIHVDQTA